MAEVDVLETCIGGFGRWQFLVFLLVSLVNIPLAMQQLSTIMIGEPMKSKCSNESIDKCSEQCPSVVWDKSVFTNTIQYEWNLICDKEWMVSTSQTVLMFGIFVGNFIFGAFADRYGRRKPLIGAVIMELITGIAIYFSPNVVLFMILRFLVCVAAGGTSCNGFVLVLETMGKECRSIFGIFSQITYFIGYALLGLFGYWFRDWRDLQLAISLQVFVLLSYYWLLPESPRWLLAVGRYDEAITQMEKIATCNKMPTENIRNNVMSDRHDIVPAKQTYFDLFRYPNVRKKTIFIYFNYFILGLCFYGVAQYQGKIPGDVFITTAVAGLASIPGHIIIIFTINSCGRKATVLFCYAISGISLLIILTIPENVNWAKSLCGWWCMIGISLAFSVAMVWATELFATPVRNVGLGSAATIAKVGSMISPYFVQAVNYYFWLPVLVFGIAPLIAILFSIWLPETRGQKLPETTEEAEKFGRKMQDAV